MADPTDALRSALTANAPETPETPAPADAGTTETTTAPETVSQDAQPTAPSGDDGPATATTETETANADVVIPPSVKEYLQQHPDQKAIVDLITGEIKSGLTPKLQEAAQLRKQLEGIDPGSIETIRQLQKLAAEDPKQVAEYFRKQAEDFDTLVAEANNANQDPLADFVPTSDTDTRLLQEIQALKAWKVQQEKVIQETALNQEAQRVHRTMDALEKKYGLQIPEDQRLQAWVSSRDTGMSVDKVWLATHHETVVQHLVKKAKNEASAVVEVKQNAAAANPAPVAPRATTDTDGEKPNTFKEFLRAARSDIEDRGKGF